jgi:enoyl-[acyl-carrier protein] reductase III
MGFEGKFAFVTGGTRGIGRAVTLALARAGADVAVNYLRNRGPAEEMRSLVAETGRRCLVLRGNVADHDHIHRMYETIGKEFGRLDMLVSNAASGVLKPRSSSPRSTGAGPWTSTRGRCCSWPSTSST